VHARTPADRVPVFTFTLKQIPVPRIVEAMDAKGIGLIDGLRDLSRGGG